MEHEQKDGCFHDFFEFSHTFPKLSIYNLIEMGMHFCFFNLENAATKKTSLKRKFCAAIFRPTSHFSSVSIMVEIQLLAFALLLGTSYVFTYISRYVSVTERQKN